MKRYLSYCFLIMLLLAGCQKIDLDDPVIGTPVFYVQMTVGGEGKNWQAGVDNYYMFTDFTLDQAGVYVFSGLLQRDSCQTGGCGESLEIRIRDSQQGGTDAANTVAPGDYAFAATASLDTIWTYDTIYTYRIDFINESNFINPAPGISVWELDDSTFSLGFSPFIFYDLTNTQPEITLTVIELSGADSCISRQTQRIVTPGINSPSCSVSITPTYNFNDSTVTLSTQVAGQPPFTYAWSNGTTTSTIQNLFIPSQEYSVTVSDANGCTSSASFISGNTFVPGIPQGCSARFSYAAERQILTIDSTAVVINDPLQLSKVTVIYTDASGKVYRSDQHPQTATAHFRIIESEDYELNEKGDPTKKLLLKFRSTLVNPNGNTIELEADEAVWGVAVPD